MKLGGGRTIVGPLYDWLFSSSRQAKLILVLSLCIA
jgi:hypothetical protein